MDGISDIARETERQAQESLRLSQGLGQAADQLRAALARFKVS
jgi:methyl-accepting chemotaxis protein